MSEQFSLKWNNYQISLTSAFKHILEEEDFVDVTLSAEGQSLKAHKVVLSACSSYFKNLLRGISPWQHPVLVLKDVRFTDLQSILEFVYLGEVNLEQARLDSFLNTAEILQIKGLTDGLKDKDGGSSIGNPNSTINVPAPSGVIGVVNAGNPVNTLGPLLTATSVPSAAMQLAAAKKLRMPSLEETGIVVAAGGGGAPTLITTSAAGKHKLDIELAESVEKRLKTEAQDPLETGEWPEVSEATSLSSTEHIIVAGDPMTMPMQISRQSYLKSLIEDLGPLHKRCPVCNMVMLKKNLSRHVRDQHSQEKPRSVCPLCGKTYKTADWLKDHIRRGHNYSKEETDDLMSKMKVDSNMNVGGEQGLNNSVQGTASSGAPSEGVASSPTNSTGITSVSPIIMDTSSISPPPPKLEIATE
eukprot:TRINITY_DN2111_c0_g1_i2.p1 TRINITY_DN2111_c0_g1~~TRINITY_DN2111_c0_g1_i2.p1  ORF type:complete len:414 (+),score=125.19 TRINITY_DN2111_c0_g1_i2:129-1370(+)